ncbi:hypothetical protein LINPERPRIM_LOCUS24030, partial [Linum perenne]
GRVFHEPEDLLDHQGRVESSCDRVADCLGERYQRIRLQLDLCVAIQLLLGDGEATHQHSSEVASFRDMLDQVWMVKVEYVYREVNRPSDYLASLGHSLPLGANFVNTSDSLLFLHTLYDLLGILLPRLIVNKR